MEKALQDCCRSMRIGKILVDSDSDTHEAHVVFAKFPDDIANRKVRRLRFLMIWILSGSASLPNHELWQQSVQSGASVKGAPGGLDGRELMCFQFVYDRNYMMAGTNYIA